MLGVSLLMAALYAASDDAGGAKAVYRPDAFQTLINPVCSHCVDEARRKAGELRDDDRVLAWVRGKYDGGAIPYRWFLVPYRVISDTYGVFVYDADADFVRGYPASLDYRFHGWRNGVMVMRHRDGTLFDCLTGLAFDGPRKGERLEPIPTVETDWGPWLKAHPGTVAYQMVPKFQPQPTPGERHTESAQTRPAPDPRLDPEERVFGLTLGGASDAWPLKAFGDAPAVARHGQRAGGHDPLGRADQDGRRIRPRDRGRLLPAGDPGRRGRRPGRPLGRPGGRLAVVGRGPGRARTAQRGSAPVAPGRDRQVVRLGGQLPRHEVGGTQRT